MSHPHLPPSGRGTTRTAPSQGAFSASLQLAQDYITPAAVCIMPPQTVEADPPPPPSTEGVWKTTDASSAASFQVEDIVGTSRSSPDPTATTPIAVAPNRIEGVGGADDEGGAGLRPINRGAPPTTGRGSVKIRLQDCLACSGCVTTAETVLVEAQSTKELCRAIRDVLLARQASSLLPLEPRQESRRRDTPEHPTAQEPWDTPDGGQDAEDSPHPSASQRPLSLPPYLFYVSISESSAVSLATYWQVPLCVAYERVAGFVLHQLHAEVHSGWRAPEEKTRAGTPTSHTSTAFPERVPREWIDCPPPCCCQPPRREGGNIVFNADSAAAECLATCYGIYFRATDLAWAQSFTVEKVCEEYEQRLREKCTARLAPDNPERLPCSSLSSPKKEERPERLPLIVSACPGWCCYCEKQGGPILHLLSQVMSSQGIAGSYVKRAWRAATSPATVAAHADAVTGTALFSKRLRGEGVRASAPAPNVFHLSIQPCFDKKLEAARDPLRETLRSDEEEGRAAASARARPPVEPAVFCTDCVLSTMELLQWMEDEEAEGDTEVPGLDNAIAKEKRDNANASDEAIAIQHPSSRCGGWRWPTRPLDKHITVKSGHAIWRISTSCAGDAHSESQTEAPLSLEAVRLLGSGGFHQHLLHYLRQRHQQQTFQNGAAGVAEGTSSSSSSLSPSTLFSMDSLLPWVGSTDFQQWVQYLPQRNRNHQVILFSQPPCRGDGLPHPEVPPGAEHLLQQSDDAGEAPIVMQVAYGFQHLQNVVRQLKKVTSSTSAAGAGASSLRKRLATLRQKPAPPRTVVSDQVAPPPSPANPPRRSSSPAGLPIRHPLTSGGGTSLWSQCTFLEVMACPDGCWNGGGQVRPARHDTEATSSPLSLPVIEEAAKDPSGAAPSPWRSTTASPPARIEDATVASVPLGLQGVLRTAQEGWNVSVQDEAGAVTLMHRETDPQAAGAVQIPFSYAALKDAEGQPWGGALLYACRFKDRRAEFDAMVNQGGVHSLQW